MGDFFMKIGENLILSLYLVLISLLFLEVSYLLNFTVFSPLIVISKYLIHSKLLAFLVELIVLFVFFFLYNLITSHIFLMFNQIYKYIVFALVDYLLITGTMKIFNILVNYLYLTTQICLISSLIIIKCVNLYSIFYINLIKYQRNKKRSVVND